MATMPLALCAVCAPAFAENAEVKRKFFHEGERYDGAFGFDITQTGPLVGLTFFF